MENINVESSGEDGENTAEYEQSTFDKVINTLLCRADVAKKKLDARPVSFFELFRFASVTDKLLIIIGVFFAFLSGVGTPLVMLLNGIMTNIFLVTKQFKGNNNFWSDASAVFYAYCVLAVVMLVITFLQYICLARAALNISRNLREVYIRSVLRQNAGWFDTQNSGTIISQLNENIDKIKDGLGDKVGLIVRGMTMFLGGIIASFIIDWRLTLVLLPIGPISAALMSSMARFVDKESAHQMNANEKASAILEESIMNVQTVASCNGQEAMLCRFSQILSKGRKFGTKICAISGLFDGLFFLAMYIFTGLGFLLGAYLYSIGDITEPGYVFAVLGVLLTSSYYLGVLSPYLMAVMHARVAAAFIYRVVDRTSPIDGTSKAGMTIENVKGFIEFKDVCFAYPTRPQKEVLRNLSWSAGPGDVVALVGHSGCGKSTCIALLTRLYENSSGSVTIDGVNVRELNINWLRNAVGVVQQEPKLFTGTIKTNIRLGCPGLTDEEIVEACKTANAHDFIEKLRDGYDTLIGAGGIQLSGGQKQRIAIARTIARNPKILLLDEATSALDAESEFVVQNALNKASVGRTTIVIAHRLSTLRNSNQIIVMDEGKVAEIGSHEQLMKKADGIYASLVNSQAFQGNLEHTSDPNITSETDDGLRSPVTRRESETSLPSTYVTSRIGRGSIIYYDQRKRKSVSIQEQPELSLSEATGKKKKPREGLLQLYANCQGNYGKLSMAVLFSTIRGLELPAFVILMQLAFESFADQRSILRSNVYVCIEFCCLGIACLIFIFLATLYFGWAAECIVDDLKVRAMRTALYRDCSYFDEPSRSQAITVTRISSEIPNIKAV